MFSVHPACEKKFYVWNFDNWIFKMRTILGRILIFYALLHREWKIKYLGANTSEASDVRCGIHYVKAREEMTTLVDESSHFILKLSVVNHHYQWFSHHMHHKEVSLFVAHNQTQLIICTGTSMADSGLCFFACKRSWQTKTSWDVVQQITLLYLGPGGINR